MVSPDYPYFEILCELVPIHRGYSIFKSSKAEAHAIPAVLLVGKSQPPKRGISESNYVLDRSKPCSYLIFQLKDLFLPQ